MLNTPCAAPIQPQQLQQHQKMDPTQLNRNADWNMVTGVYPTK